MTWNDQMGNPLNQKIRCKKCHVSAKIRRFPACEQNCENWQEVQRIRALHADNQYDIPVLVETKKQPPLRIREHTMSFDSLKANMKGPRFVTSETKRGTGRTVSKDK